MPATPPSRTTPPQPYTTCSSSIFYGRLGSSALGINPDCFAVHTCSTSTSRPLMEVYADPRYPRGIPPVPRVTLDVEHIGSPEHNYRSHKTAHAWKTCGMCWRWSQWKHFSVEPTERSRKGETRGGDACRMSDLICSSATGKEDLES